MKRISFPILFSTIIPVLFVFVAGCYKSVTRTDGNTPGDALEDRRLDTPPDYPDLPPDVFPDVYPDVPGECRIITPAVLWVEIDMDGCFAPDPHVTAIISEASPYCGEAIQWMHSIEWIDDDVVQIIPSLYMCSETWEFCDPGAITTEHVRIDLPDVGQVFQLLIEGQRYDFACLEHECMWELCYLDEVYPSDHRSNRLYSTRENIDFEVWYTTNVCGCSEFEPLRLVNPDYIDDNYYYGTLSAYVCYDECCWECDCIDTAWSEQSLESRGVPYAYEVVLDGVFKEIRGFIADHIADPASGCDVFPARITEVSSDRAYYDISEPIDFYVTIEFDSYGSDTCCERHTEVAYDVYGGDYGVYVFAFGGNCMECDMAGCPPEEYRTLHIPPSVLGLGEHIVYDSYTREVLYRFYIVGED